jgi:hypothetical protein
MATLHLNSLTCLRQQDVTGVDEWEIEVDGKKVANGTVDKGETDRINQAVPVSSSVKIAVFEANSKNSKQIGKTVELNVAFPAPSPLDFKTSGAHYELAYSLTA